MISVMPIWCRRRKSSMGRGVFVRRTWWRERVQQREKEREREQVQESSKQRECAVEWGWLRLEKLDKEAIGRAKANQSRQGEKKRKKLKKQTRINDVNHQSQKRERERKRNPSKLA
jgi:hypothetical protein